VVHSNQQALLTQQQWLQGHHKVSFGHGQQGRHSRTDLNELIKTIYAWQLMIDTVRSQ
jgi:hypothetical protein